MTLIREEEGIDDDTEKVYFRQTSPCTAWTPSDYLSDRLPVDTARAPIGRCSCGDTDWHSPLGRSAPGPHSAHLKSIRNRNSQQALRSLD